MSEHQPPSGTPEYLEYGSGGPIPPEPAAPADETPARRSRRAWWIGGGVVALLGGGAGAWAAMSFFQQGAQPAEVLPSSTMAYLSIDLDPSGGQKIDAFRTLNKFPAFKDEVGVNSVDDIKRKVGETILREAPCHGLTYAHDIEPWLGDRAAVAAVDLGGDDPAPVFVLQVRDEDQARNAIAGLDACMSEQGHLGYVVSDGWALLAESQSVADDAVAAADKNTLADDATYQRWTKAVGDAGVVNAYVAPAAGTYLGNKLGDLEQGLSRLGLSKGYSLGASSPAYRSSLRVAPAAEGPLNDALQHFKGAALTVRFTGAGLELATASDPGLTQEGLTSDQGGQVVSRLPDNTALALGIGLRPGWFNQLADRLGPTLGGGANGHQLEREMSHALGISPDDLETLLGSSTAFSVGGDVDPEALANALDPSQVPAAATVQGDPADIEQVLDQLRGQSPGVQKLLGSDSSGDLVAIGPSAAYRGQVLDGGHLGDTDAFRSVVPDADHASAVAYLNVDALQKSLSSLLESDPQTADNLEPLKAIGFSTWLDGDVAHSSFTVTTN
jgi:Protein of unknown function (DUF3352)